MSARQLLEAGYTDLVSVTPPGASLSDKSRLSPDALGKAPGVKRRDGHWSGYNFLAADPPTEAEIARWERWGSNIGLKGTRFPGLDIDVDHPTLAKLVQQEAEKLLGAAPVRTSTGSRRLLVYRTLEPFGRVYCEISFAGETYVVEALGDGRQYLVAGTHPSGSEYGWEGEPLWGWPPDALSIISPEQLQAFFTHLQELLSGRAVVTIGRAQSAAAQAPVAQDGLQAPSPADVSRMVTRIPNVSPDRSDYIEIGCAIKAAGGEFEDWWEWCERWEGGTNDIEVARADWDRMHPPFRVGWNWLVEQAEAAGYVSAQDEFEALADVPEPPAPLAEGLIDFTDTWVVERLARMLRDELRYVPQSGHWHCWVEGHVWAPDEVNLAPYLIRQGLTALSREVVQLAAGMPNKKEAAAILRVAKDLQGRHALTKAEAELKAHPQLTLRVEDFDSDDLRLNTPGGIVNLETGALTPPDPGALCSRATAVTPSEERPVRWLRFLDELTDGDADLQSYLQKLAGYALTGLTQEQVLAFIHGPGGSGKSVFIDTIAGVCGSYHVTAAADTFAASKSDRHPTDVARLAGARLVTSVETAEGRAWDTQRVKSLTGGDEVTARFMREDFFEYKPKYQIVIVGNYEPEVQGVDEALMRRLHIVPFEHPVPQEKRDRLLARRLEAEWPGILQWMIDGCRKWIQFGLQPPGAVVARTEQYRQEEDPVGEFLKDCCELDPEAEVPRRDLYRVWARWCRDQGEDPGTEKQLKRRFRTKQLEHGWDEVRIATGSKFLRGYRGLKLRSDDDEFPTDMEG